MDARQILDELLRSGKEIAEKGGSMAEQRLNIPEAGPERDAMLRGLGKGAAAAGALALLVGTRGGRRVTGTALKLGSLAALGGVGYTAYRNWQEKQSGGGGSANKDLFSGLVDSSTSESRSRVMLRAMIAAAKADGHIDAAEQANIKAGVEQLELDADIADFIQTEAAKPLDVAEVAAGADTPEAATEIWLASRMIVDADNAPERSYLDSLAAELNLAPDLINELEAQLA